MKYSNPTVLVILDGFGYSAKKKYNAIAHASIPHFNAWWQNYPHALLKASGKAVGLPDGMIGNSEVGHFTIGAGRIIDQPMKVWLESVENNTFLDHAVLKEKLEKLRDVGGALHILGLLSDAGVHAHEKHMHVIIDIAIKAQIKKIVIHPFLDGRDVLPQSAHEYLHRLMQVAKYYNTGHVIIGSLHGRFYAMDRDHHWDRIEKSYRIFTQKQSIVYDSWEKVLERNYAQGTTDEFIFPVQLNSNAIIHNGDGIIMCNVRPDRSRQLASCFVESLQNYVKPFITKPLNLTFFITPVEYDVNLATTVLFPRKVIHNTLKNVLAQHNKTIFTIAETEKYAHVTYFFNGENEECLPTETRTLIASLSAENYITQPHMKAHEITDSVVKSLKENPKDFYLINYANADMVGHSGHFGATIQAIECLDTQLGILYEQVVNKMNGTLYIAGDHGKAEDMFDEESGQPRTGHTNNPVPFVMVKDGMEKKELKLEGLADIAPFIVQNMGLGVPEEMKKKSEKIKRR